MALQETRTRLRSLTFPAGKIPPPWRYEGDIPGGVILYVHYLADEDDVFAEIFGDDLAGWEYAWEGEVFDGWHVYTFLAV